LAEASVAITAGSGTNLHTNTRTISATTMHEEFTLPGEYPYATYILYAAGISAATAASHVAQIMAGSSLNVRIRRITVQQLVAPTGAVRLEIARLTSAGTGGGAITARPLDSADSAAGATGMQLPTVKGTEALIIGSLLPNMVSAVGTATKWEWTQRPNGKPIIIAAGTSNGIALKSSGLATATVDWEIEFVETAYV